MIYFFFFISNIKWWLQTCRQEYWYEAIDEQDLKQEHINNHNNNNHKDHDKWNKFCGTGYAAVTTYENLRRNTNVYISNRWSYVVLDDTYIHTIYISWNRHYIIISSITHIVSHHAYFILLSSVG